jgi:hypothetical protein
MFANLFGIKEAATNKSIQPPHINTAIPFTVADLLIPDDTTLEQVRVEMLHLMGQENLNHHRMGQLYNFVVDKKLAEKAGYKDAKDFFTQRLVDLSQPALTMYGAVAAAFSAAVTRRFGVTCLSLLLTYAEAADMKVNHEEPGNTPIEVPDDKGEVSTQPFGNCSVDQMRRALKRKRKPSSSKPVPAEAEALADQYRAAVQNRFTKGTRIKVLVRNEKGEAVLDFKGIPVAQVSKLAAALTEEPPKMAPVEEGAMG